MRDLLILTIHLIVTVAKRLRPGGVRAVAAESLSLKYQLIVSNRVRLRSPNLTTLDRFLIGLTALFIDPRRNPNFGCVRIAQQINFVFDLDIDKDVVRRVLAKHYRPGRSGFDGPSWLTFLAHAKDRLWSLDLFRCDSVASLRGARGD